jgi:GrpB-like predicted nucleotidyltransferase (UPF0157 family)
MSLWTSNFGSTSIPGLAAKPIVDILMAVRSLSEVIKIRPALESAGYEYRENGSDDVQILFAKGPEVKRTHYLHITALGSSGWQNPLAFRDYLRTHPDELRRYEELKQNLAERYSDHREQYTAGKKDYVDEGVTRATTTK